MSVINDRPGTAPMPAPDETIEFTSQAPDLPWDSAPSDPAASNGAQGMVLPFKSAETGAGTSATRLQAEPAAGNILAVLGGALDNAVVRLSLVLARESGVRVDLLLLVEVPIGLPIGAYGEWLSRQEGALDLSEAEQLCGPCLGGSEIVLCRRQGPALVDEARARQASGLVISAPKGGWWARLRGRQGIAHVQARADCRVYVVYVPPPIEERALAIAQ